ncbi:MULTISPECIES: DUF2627 domain-containing protein [Alteribacter]|uniref:DUF2627 domain-containing protein n=1 Tax=Alteribacter keqinensis TaxID=2483800 RepID=A0A3M7TYM4_9BACI|nr:DUF2627 domain-containing protein [Alteribacter keqinensis]MBM7097265.1 DUF2627 domain-containing protein [Alteribacter salitolerans]RNA70563.1 DUF2627 domain-containing protein [Alteribacter keqinensis]
MQRFLALIVLVIPGLIAGYGIKLMRDTVFTILNPPFPFLLLQFFAGLLALILGVWFIGGFILHRDRKNNKVAPRFQKQS